VTVAIATHRGHDRIAGCLDSIASQTAAGAFEVVVVDNGPDTGTRRVVAGWAETHPAIPLSVVRTEVANVARARNLALDEARGQYVAFVDDDDRIAPRYLERLLAHASPRTVPVAMPLVAPDGDFDRLAGPLGTWGDLRRHVSHSCHQTEIQMVWAPVWAKLVSTEVARRVRFDERLSDVAEDVVFCLRAAASANLRLVLTELADDAAYLYSRRAGGLTRPVAPTFDTHVDQPLVAVAAIAEAGVLERDELREVGWRVVAHAAKRIADYLAAHPDESDRVDAATAPFRPYLDVVEGQPR
jgi:glycosyltransferase involved in cell wall biosynthesis